MSCKEKSNKTQLLVVDDFRQLIDRCYGVYENDSHCLRRAGYSKWGKESNWWSKFFVHTMKKELCLEKFSNISSDLKQRIIDYSDKNRSTTKILEYIVMELNLDYVPMMEFDTAVIPEFKKAGYEMEESHTKKEYCYTITDKDHKSIASLLYSMWDQSIFFDITAKMIDKNSEKCLLELVKKGLMHKYCMIRGTFAKKEQIRFRLWGEVNSDYINIGGFQQENQSLLVKNGFMIVQKEWDKQHKLSFEVYKLYKNAQGDLCEREVCVLHEHEKVSFCVSNYYFSTKNKEDDDFKEFLKIIELAMPGYELINKKSYYGCGVFLEVK